MSAMTENPTLMSDLAREQQRRRTMIGQVYRQGRDMHAANVKLNDGKVEYTPTKNEDPR